MSCVHRKKLTKNVSLLKRGIKMTLTSVSNDKSILLVVDSRLRDKRKYPDPNNYTIELSSPLSDVTKIRLVNATIPGDALYSLPVNRAAFKLRMSGGSYQNVTMRSGEYGSYQDVATALESVLVDAGLVDASISIGAIDHHLIVSSTSEFSLSFAEDGPSHFMGFGISSYDSVYDAVSSVWKLVAPFKLDLDAHKRYVTIEMSQPGGGSQPVVIGSPSSTNDAIAVYIFNRDHSISKCERVWDPPLFSFNRLSISMKDEYGNLMDFQNQDHVLEFSVSMRINTNRFF